VQIAAVTRRGPGDRPHNPPRTPPTDFRVVSSYSGALVGRHTSHSGAKQYLRRTAENHVTAHIIRRREMSTNTLLIIVLVVLLLGGGGFFWRRR
jgi:LPXTG-motif cell wall-anchored protein